MSKRAFRFAFVTVVLISATGALFATGQREAAVATELPPGPLLPWTGEQIVWSGFGADLGITGDQSMRVYAEYLDRVGNARIEWETFPWNDYDQKLNLYIASADLPDIFWARDAVVKAHELGHLGMFLDWNAYADRMPNAQRYAEEYPHFNHAVNDRGQRFTITDLANAEYIGEGWFYNPTILERAGISRPPETMQEMMEQMKTVKARVPGADGYLSYWGMDYVLYAFGHLMNVVGTGGSRIAYDADRGEWIYAPTMNPNYRSLIEYLSELYRAGVFNEDAVSVGISDERVNELLDAGNYAFIHWYHVELEQRWGRRGEEPPLVGMKPPAHDGQSHFYITVPHDSVGYWGYMSSADVKMPEVLASYVDNIISQDSYMLFTWGIEGETYEVGPDGVPEFLDPYTDAEVRSEAGVGNFWDVRYIKFDDRYNTWFTAAMPPTSAAHEPAVADVRRLMRGETTPIWPWSRPLMTPEQNEEIGRIMTPINTFVSEEQLKFITGARSMAEWDTFVSQINRMGNIDRVLEYFNGGQQWPMGERRYPRIP